MNRVDRIVVGTLVVLLALIASLVGLPSVLPGDASRASVGPSSTDAPLAEPRAYREGMVGHATSVSPLTAHSQADRDLVALVFSGLVRNGPDGTIVPDLATRWTVDADRRGLDVRRSAGRSLAGWRTGHRRGCRIHHPDAPGSVLHRPRRRVVAGRDGQDRRRPDRGVHAVDAARRVPPGGHPADRTGPHPGRGAGRPAGQRPVRPAADRFRPVRAGESHARRRGTPSGCLGAPGRSACGGLAIGSRRLPGDASSDRFAQPVRSRISQASSSGSSTTPQRSSRPTAGATWTPPRDCRPPR